MSAEPVEGEQQPHPDSPEGQKPAKKATAKKTAKKAAAKKTTPRGDNRASGKPAATEEGEASADELTSPPEDRVLPEEREEWFRNPGFQRMRTDWTGKDKQQMDRLQVVIDKAVFDTFPEAYGIMSDIYDIVREQVSDDQGTLLVDAYGFKVWKRNPMTGLYYEDWSELSYRQREDFLFRITTQLFEWEQRAADLWTRAMFSKGMFVERFSIEYDAPMHGTIDDRNARGNKEAAEERYFALMNSAISRKAEALVRTMTNLQLRLKDTLGQ